MPVNTPILCTCTLSVYLTYYWTTTPPPGGDTRVMKNILQQDCKVLDIVYIICTTVHERNKALSQSPRQILLTSHAP